MSDARPPIPEPVKREVRQRSGFGCVVCGLPLFEYEHMLGWANVQRHVAEEITLLCNQHHRERTSGLLPTEAVESANQNPINLRVGHSSPYMLHYSGGECRATVGSNVLRAATGNDFVAVMIDGVPLIGFRHEAGHYLLNVLLFDETNKLVLRIVDNELMFSAEPWDIEFVGTRLVIRSAARSIFFDVVFEPPNGVRIDRGRLLLNGVELFLRPEFILVTNNSTLISGSTMINGSVAVNIGDDARGLGSAVRVDGVPRYSVDRDTALRWAREQMGVDVLQSDDGA